MVKIKITSEGLEIPGTAGTAGLAGFYCKSEKKLRSADSLC